MVNFFGLYIDPVYILILTVAIVSGFLVVLSRVMLKMQATLESSLQELRMSDAAREAKALAKEAAQKSIDELEAKVAELRRVVEDNGKDKERKWRP